MSIVSKNECSSLKYLSTRGRAPVLEFEDVVLTGLARDGGLYLPVVWPTFSPQKIAAFAGRPFSDVAVEVISAFTGGTPSVAELQKMAQSAYGSFRHSAVTPLVQIDPQTFILELFHGPTLAFKDIAMQFITHLMDHILSQRNQTTLIVGATSGDTGGAAIEAFRHSSRAQIVILFPRGRISDVQRRMMTTRREKNVHAVAIEGTFDDCQALVKALFNDHAFRDQVRLSGINSINWGRIVAQITYYFVAGVALGAPHRSLVFSVPTGNFGDIFAGYVARRMGLPIDMLIIGTNENDILPRTHQSGVYEMREVHATTTPSMDIQISSNFERYLFEAGGRDADCIVRQMQQLSQSRRFELSSQQLQAFRKEFYAAAITEKDVSNTIQKTLRESSYLLDPHTACGLAAAKHILSSFKTTSPCVILATAHPAKFPDTVKTITGQHPALPLSMQSLLTDKETYSVLPNRLGDVQQFILSVS